MQKYVLVECHSVLGHGAYGRQARRFGGGALRLGDWKRREPAAAGAGGGRPFVNAVVITHPPPFKTHLQV